MYGRWLMLPRVGPDLLRPSPLGADPDALDSGEYGGPSHGAGDGLNSREAEQRLSSLEEPRSSDAASNTDYTGPSTKHC
jgi:hypothetical protein